MIRESGWQWGNSRFARVGLIFVAIAFGCGCGKRPADLPMNLETPTPTKSTRQPVAAATQVPLTLNVQVSPTPKAATLRPTPQEAAAVSPSDVDPQRRAAEEERLKALTKDWAYLSFMALGDRKMARIAMDEKHEDTYWAREGEEMGEVSISRITRGSIEVRLGQASLLLTRMDEPTETPEKPRVRRPQRRTPSEPAEEEPSSTSEIPSEDESPDEFPSNETSFEEGGM